ncbi:MAG: Uma2 family endonuclease [Armatimonadetes bacterium]|nr:Uma2 family endonuclease [Armatimonadota bacterium]
MSVTSPAPRHAAGPRNNEFHWTTDRFYRAAAAGVFDDPGRLELIHGRIIEKMPYSPRHTALIGHIAKRLRAVLNSAVTVRAEAAIHIAFDGEPIPDISVIRGDDLDYLARHAAPEDVVLLVEVAISSERGDLGEKALLYAKAGISDYWVVLPEAGEIVVHRDPTEEGYQSVTRVGEDGAIRPLAAPEAVLSVRDLLGEGMP